MLDKMLQAEQRKEIGRFQIREGSRERKFCWLPGWFLAREKDKVLYLGDLKAKGGILCFLPDYSWKLQDSWKVSCILMMKNNAVNAYSVQSLSRVWLFATPWIVAPQAPRSWVSQARILEWVAYPACRGSSQTRDWTQVSRIGRQVL